MTSFKTSKRNERIRAYWHNTNQHYAPTLTMSTSISESTESAPYLNLDDILFSKQFFRETYTEQCIKTEQLRIERDEINYHKRCDNPWLAGTSCKRKKFLAKSYEMQSGKTPKQKRFEKMLKNALDRADNTPQKRIDVLKRQDEHSDDLISDDFINDDYDAHMLQKKQGAVKRAKDRHRKRAKCKSYTMHVGTPTVPDDRIIIRIWHDHIVNTLGSAAVPTFEFCKDNIAKAVRLFKSSNNALFNAKYGVGWTVELFIKLLSDLDWTNSTSVIKRMLLIAQLMNPDFSIAAQTSGLFERIVNNIPNLGSSVIFADLRTLLAGLGAFQMQAGEDGDDDEEEHNKYMEEIDKIWNLFSNSDIATGLLQLATLLVTAGMLDEKEIKLGTIEVFSLKKAREAATLSSFYECVKQILVGVIEGVEIFKAKGTFDGFYSKKSLESQCAYALSLYQQLQIGRLMEYSDGLTVEMYQDQLIKLRRKLQTKIADKNERQRYLYTQYLNRIEETISGVAALAKDQLQQETAYAILLLGESGVGKSWLSTRLCRYILQVNGYPHDKENMITFNPNSAYDDQIKNNTFGMQIDDFGHIKPGRSDASKRSPTEIILCVVSNIAWPALKADVAEKGYVFFHIRSFVASTNNPTLNTEFDSTKPGAPLKRFKLHITQIVKKGWSKPQSTEINAGLVQSQYPGDPYPDVWTFNIDRIKLVDKSKSSGTGWVYERLKTPRGSENFNLRELMELIAQDSQAHFAVEKQNMELVKDETIALDEDTLLPKVMINKSYQMQVAQTHPLFADFDEEEEDEEEVTEEEMDLMSNNPNIQVMTTLLSNYRGNQIIDTVPTFASNLWYFCGGNVITFLGYSLMLISFLPFMLAMWGGLICKTWAIGIFVAEAILLKDITVMMVARIMAHTSCDRVVRAVWRRAMDRNIQTKTLKYAAGAIAGAALLRWIWKRSPKDYECQSETVKKIDEEVMAEKKDRVSLFPSFRGIFTRTAGPTTKTMTSPQMLNNIGPGQVVVQIGGCKVRGSFVQHGVLMIPYHIFEIEEREDKIYHMLMTKDDGDSKTIVVDLNIVNGRKQFQRFGNDGVVLHLTGVRSSKPILEYFPEIHAKEGYSAAHFMYRKTDTQLFHGNVTNLGRERFRYTHTSDDGSVLEKYCHGFKGISDFEPQKGHCGALVIAHRRCPEIIGMHIAGSGSTKSQLTMPISRPVLEEAIDNLLANSPFPYRDASILHEMHAGEINGEMHKFASAKVIRPEDPIEILGPTGKLTKNKFQTKKSPIHEAVKSEFGVETLHGVPPSKGKMTPEGFRCPYENGLKEIGTGENLLPASYLMRAQDEIVTYLSQFIDAYERNGGLNRPLTLEEATNGGDIAKTARGAKMSTSGGRRFPGKKLNHLKNKEFPYEIDDDVREAVEETMECLRQGKRTKSVLKANLKDEPTKLKKVEQFRTRVFFGLSFDMVLAHNVLCTAFLEFMTLLGLDGLTAIWMNMASHDIETLIDRLEWKDSAQKEEIHGVIADFKHFDKSLPESLMQTAWGVGRRITAKFSGFDDEHIKMLEGLSVEMTSPVIDWNGVLLVLFLTHTSGNGSTTLMGSLAGLILLMTAFYKVCDPDGSKNLKALDHIRSIHNGDDFISTTNHPDFDYFTTKQALADFGVEITPSDKDSEGTRHQSIYEDAFLSRVPRYCDLRQSWVGCLKKDSIFKALMWILPSAIEEEKVQMGQTISSMLDESSLYDREFFEQVHSFAKRMVEEHGFVVSHIDWEYDQYVLKWAVDSGRRYKDYRMKRKSFIDSLISKYPLSATQVFYATGKEVEDPVPEVITYEMQAGKSKASVNWLSFIFLCIKLGIFEFIFSYCMTFFINFTAGNPIVGETTRFINETLLRPDTWYRRYQEHRARQMTELETTRLVVSAAFPRATPQQLDLAAQRLVGRPRAEVAATLTFVRMNMLVSTGFFDRNEREQEADEPDVVTYEMQAGRSRRPRVPWFSLALQMIIFLKVMFRTAFIGGQLAIWTSNQPRFVEFEDRVRNRSNQFLRWFYRRRDQTTNVVYNARDKIILRLVKYYFPDVDDRQANNAVRRLRNHSIRQISSILSLISVDVTIGSRSNFAAGETETIPDTVIEGMHTYQMQAGVSNAAHDIHVEVECCDEIICCCKGKIEKVETEQPVTELQNAQAVLDSNASEVRSTDTDGQTKTVEEADSPAFATCCSIH